MHEGKLVKQMVKEKGIKITEFANAICRSRRDVYHIFKRKTIHGELQQRISKFLNCTFSTTPSHETKKHLVVMEANEEQLQEIVSKFHIIVIYDV